MVAYYAALKLTIRQQKAFFFTPGNLKSSQIQARSGSNHAAPALHAAKRLPLAPRAWQPSLQLGAISVTRRLSGCSVPSLLLSALVATRYLPCYLAISYPVGVLLIILRSSGCSAHSRLLRYQQCHSPPCFDIWLLGDNMGCSMLSCPINPF